MKLSAAMSTVLATANALVLTPDTRGPLPVGLHSQYTIPGTDEVITVHYQPIEDCKLIECDICPFVPDRAGKAYSSVATFAAAKAQITITSYTGAANAISNYRTEDSGRTATGGFGGWAKIFISEQAATLGGICYDDYGIDWKARLRRGLLGEH
ncbi:hypothetical protein F5B21DRAFT_504613 [Xylaria acuta]|nr:hypothetical protein F5B21DRAFT_504613 [Xylaria acuta]